MLTHSKAVQHSVAHSHLPVEVEVVERSRRTTTIMWMEVYFHDERLSVPRSFHIRGLLSLLDQANQPATQIRGRRRANSTRSDKSLSAECQVGGLMDAGYRGG